MNKKLKFVFLSKKKKKEILFHRKMLQFLNIVPLLFLYMKNR